MSWHGAVLCRHCAKVIAARTLKAMKGELSCGAQRTVGFFKKENPMSENVNTGPLENAYLCYIKPLKIWETYLK